MHPKFHFHPDQSWIEYALIVVLSIAVFVIILVTMGAQIQETFSNFIHGFSR